MNDRYVYVLTDAGKVFYVGKGTHATSYTNKYRRYDQHIAEAQLPVADQSNPAKCQRINDIISRGDTVGFALLLDDSCEEQAINLETKLILQYGREADGGCLTNIVTEQALISHELRRKAVFCFSTNGEYINSYSSVKEAALAHDTSSGTIVSCCRGKYKTAAGLVWSYSDTFPGYVKHSPWNIRAVDCYTIDGVLLLSYTSATEAEARTGVSASSINKCVNGEAFSAGNMRWSLHDNPIVNNTNIVSNIAGRKRRQVGQYNKNGELIQVYDIASDAVTATGYTGIPQVLAGYRKTAGGFMWKYMETEK